LATIGVNEAARSFIKNFDPFGGPTGMTLKFSVYNSYGGANQALWIAYGAVAALAVVILVVSYLVKTSRFGLGLMAIRENEDAAEVMGVVTPSSKTWAYVISAIFPGMIGVLFFFKNGNIEPGDAFVLHQSIESIVMVMLGGQGTVLGPLFGAAAYQRLRGLLLVSPLFKNIQLTVAGVLLLAIVLFVPAGVIGWLRHRFPRLRGVLE
jgi:branched-chain amino acid transport system permease protein